MNMSSQVQQSVSSSSMGSANQSVSLQQQISQSQGQQNFTLAAAAAVAVQQQQNQALAAAAAAAAAAATSGSAITGVGNSSVISSVLNNATNTMVPGGIPLGVGGGGQTMNPEAEKIFQCIGDLLNSDSRESALMELSRKRESVPDLAIMLWHSFGSIAALLQEIVAVYPTIHPPTLNAHQSNRVCNALALLQCVASHPETRAVFLQANMPLFLYPFLSMNTSSKTRPFEYLRLTSLGVIGALVKTDEKEVINFLLKTEIIPLCLRIMESGTELSKTVATFILQKILLDETGLNYICQTYDRFSHVAMILAKMVIALAKEQSARLLKHVIRCYLRLSDNPRAREALRQCLPDQLKNSTFMSCLKDDRTTKNWLIQLLKNIEPKPGEAIPGGGIVPGGPGQPGGSSSSNSLAGGGVGGGGIPGQSSPSPSGGMMNSMMSASQQQQQQSQQQQAVQQQQQQQQGIKSNKM